MKFGLLIFIFLLNHSIANDKKPPLREVAVIVTQEGYYPKSISVFQGEKIRFFVTSTVENPSCMIVDNHKVFLAANKGKMTETEVLFDRSGEFSMYCPGSKNTGKVVVITKQAPKRDVASEKTGPSMIWMPKEY